MGAPDLHAEEAGRAQVYRLLARLFRAPPDEQLLQAIAASGDVEAELRGVADPWSEVACAAAWGDAEAIQDEYDAAFAGRRGASLLRMSARCEALQRAIEERRLDLEAQRRYFRRHIPAAQRRCERLMAASGSRFYAELGRFAAAFFRLEDAAFDLTDYPQPRSLQQ